MHYIPDNHIKGLIFDFDGTIVDSMPVHLLSWREAFSQFHCNFDEKFFYDNAGVSLTGVVENYNHQYGHNLNPLEIANLKNELHFKYVNQTLLIPSVFSIIERYHNTLPMAVATGNATNITHSVMTHLGITHFFDAIVCAEDVNRSKPAPDCFLEAAKRIGIPPHHCEVFEDGDPGLQGAHQAGMKATDIRTWV